MSRETCPGNSDNLSLSQPSSAMANEDIKSQSGWDSHGFQANRIVQLNKLSGLKKYKVSNVKFLDPTTGSPADGAHEWFGDLAGLRPGGIYTKQDLIQNLEYLSSSHYFEKIDFDAKTNPDGTVDIYIPFEEKIYPSKALFRCLSIGTIPEEKEAHEWDNVMNKSYQKRIGCARECLLPQQVRERIEGALRQQTSLRSSLLRRIVFHVEKWYHDNGFYGARVVRHGPLESNDQLIFEVNEGDITKLDFKFQDKLGNICKGNTNIGVIKRALPREIAVGKAYNIRALDKAYESIYSLNLFSNVNIIPQFDHRNGAMSAEIVLQERPQKWRTDVRTCLKMVPGLAFLPTLTSLQQSGTTIYFERQNIKGLNRSFQGAITLSNLFYPEDFNFEYTHPYMDGLDDPRNRTLRASCFNTRQHSPVFRCGPRANDKPICVDRKGFKATITENYTEKSKFTYGVVMEDIRTRDEDGSIAARGHRVSFNGPQVRNNSPDSTTLSGTGIDRMATFQANLTRDNTISVNGTIVGARDVIQVDQGVGIDTKPAFFNRLQMSATRFIPLRNVQEGEGNAAPPLLVLHGAIGNCVGDVPYHEAFTIGGPNSARGYNVGETAASRRKLEVAAEIRVPVKNTNTNLCGFVEHRNDLGGSIGSPENRTRGHGSSAGVGIQLGLLRAEYVLDDSSGKGSVLFHLGERF